MYNMALDTLGEGVKIFGYPQDYFILPLLVFNLLILIVGHKKIKPDGISLVVLFWMSVVPLLSFLFVPKFQYFIEMLVWPTSYLASYIITRKNENNFKSFSYVFLIVFFMGVFYFQQGKIGQLDLNSRGFENGANSIFCVLSVVPFILLLDSKRLKYFILIITLLAVAFSNKRSAFIILGVSLMPTMWGLLPSKYSAIKKLFIFSLFLFGVISLFLYIENAYLGNKLFERFATINDDEGSGRSVIWYYVIDNYLKGDFFSKIFGVGHNGVSNLGWASAAHNDFLDVLYDYGALSLIIYICLHVAVLKRLCFLIKTHSSYLQSYFFMTTVFVVMSWVSILIVQQRYLIYMAIYWGMVEAQLCRADNIKRGRYECYKK